MPTLIGLMVAVAVLRESGFMEVLGKLLGKVTNPIGFPGELMPVTIVKIFSSSAATGMVLDIFKEYGPDSYMGKVTSLMMSCTETVFYTMSVYYITAKVTRTRWTLAGAILTTISGTIAQCNACKCNLNNIYFELRSENAEVRNDIYSYI